MNFKSEKIVPAVTILIIIAGTLLRLDIAIKPIGNLFYATLYDDSFYSLQIARNIADGKGFTFDGVTPTDGFQPLFVFIMVPVYKFFTDPSGVTPVRICMIFQALLSLITGFLIYRFIKDRLGDAAGIAALFAWMLDPHIIRETMNGLETGLASFFVVLATILYVKKLVETDQATIKSGALLGVILGFGILARLDVGLFALAIGMDTLYRSAKRGGQEGRGLFKAILTASIAAFIVAGPWFLYIRSAFGNFMPASGKAIRFISQAFGDWFVSSPWGLVSQTPPVDVDAGKIPSWFYLGSFKEALEGSLEGVPFLWGMVGVIGFACISVVLSIFAFKSKTLETVKDKISSLRFLLIAYLILLAVYSFYVFGQHYFRRYFFPYASLLGVILICITVKYLSERLPNFKVKAVVAVISAIICLAATFTETRRLHTRGLVSEYYAAAIGIKDNTEPDAVIGAFQAGTIGYFSGRKTVNLDGVVDSGSLEAMKNNRIDLYVRKRNVDYIADFQPIIDKLFIARSSKPDSLESGYVKVAEIGRFIIYKRAP